MSGSQLTLNLIDGSVSFKFSPEAAQELKKEVASLMASLKAVAASATPGAGVKPVRHKSMEYRYTGDIFLEIECNPNIWPSPFAAKVLLTVRDDRLRLTTQAELTRLIEDVNIYLEQAAG